jgi:hypothetical protein
MIAECRPGGRGSSIMSVDKCIFTEEHTVCCSDLMTMIQEQLCRGRKINNADGSIRSNFAEKKR